MRTFPNLPLALPLTVLLWAGACENAAVDTPAPSPDAAADSQTLGDGAAADAGTGGADAATGGATDATAGGSETATGNPDVTQPGPDAVASTDTGGTVDTGPIQDVVAPTDGGPNPIGGACTGPGSCGPTAYCATADGGCGGKGECKAKPGACDTVFSPVCGCDGKDYSNACEANGAGTSVAKAGACKPAGGECGGGCPPDSKCMPPEGTCGPGDKCVKLPGACTKEYAPVCGCDGQTYGNKCMALAAGQGYAATGACGPAPTGCDIGGTECGKSAYCAGGCSGKGQCAPKPGGCIQLFDPVCGCDGKTYGNACTAASAGMNVASKGECGAAKTTWWTTCGGPVCQGWKPNPDVPLCVTQKPGDGCTKADELCDPKGQCGEYLKCTDSDPTVNGCPKSRRSLKADISYLDAGQRQKLSQDLLQTRLATYRYTAQGPQGKRHLGFILDDQPGSPAVDEKRDMVDLYGYLSMSVAALQEQQQRIDALEAELRAMRTHCR